MIENLLSAAPSTATAWFYRTAAGAEIDLLLEIGPGRLWAIDVKRSLDPQATKGFHLACEDVKATHRFVVYPGNERYRVDRITEAVPLPALVQEVAG